MAKKQNQPIVRGKKNIKIHNFQTFILIFVGWSPC